MAYPDLEESNRVQREAYARNPVSSGAGRPVAAEPDPSVPALFRGESSASPPEPGRGFGSFVSDAIDSRAAQRLVERDGPAPSPIAGSAIVSDAARQPRVSTPTYGNEGRGNGQPNIVDNTVPAAPVAAQPTPYDREGTQQQLDAVNRRLGLRDAAEAQGQQASLTDHLATTDRLQAGQDLVRAESEARVARFRAVNGADVVLRGPGTRAAAAELSKQAAAAGANVDAIKGRATAPIVPTGTPLKDALDQREALSRGQLVDSTTQNGAVTAAVEKQKLDQAKRVSDLGHSLLAETDPKKREIAQKNLLTLMGKDPRKNYTAMPVSQPDSVDPTTGAVVKGGQSVVIVGDDGSREVVQLGPKPGAAPGGAEPKEGEVRTDPVSKQTRKYVNGKWVPV